MANKKPALVDISGVDYLVSFGIRMLHSAIKSMRANSTRLALLKPQPQVEEILRTANLHEVIIIAQDEAEAQARLGVGSGSV